jgi:hypothetical protein
VLCRAPYLLETDQGGLGAGVRHMSIQTDAAIALTAQRAQIRRELGALMILDPLAGMTPRIVRRVGLKC